MARRRATPVCGPFQRRLSEDELDSYPIRRVRVKNVNFLGRVLPVDGMPVAMHGKFFSKPLMNTQGAIECVSIWNSANNYYEYLDRSESAGRTTFGAC